MTACFSTVRSADCRKGYFELVRLAEEMDAKDWKTHAGTGPFQITEYVQGNSQTYVKNPNYWDTERLAGSNQKLP